MAVPIFQLAPPEGIDPAAIEAGTPLGELLLVLAGTYNDLKGLMVFSQLLGGSGALASMQAESVPLATRGQFHGMMGQLARTMAGVVHELLVELKEQRPVIESPEFAKLLGQATREARRSWKVVVGVAFGEKSAAGARAEELRKMLVIIRNNLAFHYSSKVLARGYQRHFADPTKPHSSRAVFSDGRTMEETRFYFADAAAEAAMSAVTGVPVPELGNRIGAIAGDVNLAIKPIVMAHLRGKATATRYGWPDDGDATKRQAHAPHSGRRLR